MNIMNNLALKKTDDGNSSVLKTPSGFNNKDASEIAMALNGLVADAFALYIKTKNFHWHMSGPHFRDHHLLFDEQADQIFASIDPLAERVRKIGQTTLKSIGQISKVTQIENNDKEFVSPFEMVSELVADNRMMAESMRKCHALCDDKEDAATAGLLEIYIDEAERRTWFLFETSRNSDRSGH
jgi:starvation-inducible DNA-binding protein